MGKKYEDVKNKKQHVINVKRVQNNKDMQKIVECLADEHLFRESVRNSFLFDFGLATGLRVSDIVRIKRKDVENKKVFTIYEKKTGKKRDVDVSNIVLKIMDYLEFCDNNGIKCDYLFYRKRGDSNTHMKEDQVYKILRKVGDLVNIDYLGTHTMRKTFGYNVYKTTNNISLVMDFLNHSSEKTTKRYIGWTDEQKRDALANMDIYNID